MIKNQEKKTVRILPKSKERCIQYCGEKRVLDKKAVCDIYKAYVEHVKMSNCFNENLANQMKRLAVLSFEAADNTYIITTAQDTFTAVKEALEAADVKEFLECELTYIPNMEVELDEESNFSFCDKCYEAFEYDPEDGWIPCFCDKCNAETYRKGVF